MSISEKLLEQRLIRACKKYKIINIKGESRNNVGFPDRIIFNSWTKTIHYVELKNDTYYRQTPSQIRWQDIIETAGGEYFLINGEDELKAYINYHIIPKGEEK